ncbi:MAG: hypothetical protein IJK04_09940, partial [Kiritimatiellae bacterium]|nr:hypothetical protein [Kiritimatiellia bacterium]
MRLKLPSAQALKAAGGRLVRTTEARVNGEEARVSVIGFDCPLNEAEASIRRLWNLPAPASSVTPLFTGTWLTRTESGTRQDIFLFPGNSSETCSAWLAERVADNGEAGPISPPGGDPLPGGKLTGCIEMKDTGSVLTLHEFDGLPSDAVRAVEAGLTSRGWGIILSGDTTAYFAKDGHAAVACAYSADGATRVAILRSGRK